MARGVLYGIISHGLFIITGYIIHVYAGRKFGAEMYGTFGVVLSVLTISYIFLQNGIRQVIAKNVALSPDGARGLLYRGLCLQLIVSCIISMGVYGFSQKIGGLLNDSGLILPLKICCAVIIMQSVYFIFTSTLNGLKRFLAENLLVSAYALLKPITVLIMIWLGFGVSGAILGFFFASTLAVVCGLFAIVRLSNSNCSIKFKYFVKHAIINSVTFASMAALSNIDLLFVKRIMPAMDYTGFYTAAAAFSKPPYWLLFAFGSVALPLVTFSFSKGDILQCKIYFSQIIRYSTIIILPIIVIISSTSNRLIVFFYSPEFELAGPPLSILIFGIWLLGLVAIMTHLMIGIGKGGLMAAMSLFAIIIDVILNMLLVSRLGLNGAAIATTLSAFLLLFASGWYLKNKIGIEITLLTVFRITFLLIILFGLSHMSILDQFPLLIEYILLYVLFLIGLVVTKEIGSEDYLVIKQMLDVRTQTRSGSFKNT